MKTGKSLTPLVSGIGLVIVFLATSALLTLHPQAGKNSVRYLIDHSKRVLSYKITNTKEALFRIGPQDSRIEILSNLDVYPDTLSNSELSPNPEEREYALEIKILDSDLNPIHSDVFKEKTRMTTWVEPETDNPMKSAYYLYENLGACDSRITSLNLRNIISEECFIAVKIYSPINQSASVRAYRHLDLTAERDIKGLRLMPKRFRAKLARHNLYENSLSHEELSRSMTDVLSQIPAETRVGFEYSTRQLFLYEDVVPLLGPSPPLTTLDSSLGKPVFLSINGPAILTVSINGTQSIQTTIWRNDVLLSDTPRIPDSKQQLYFDIGSGSHVLKLQDTVHSQTITSVTLDPPTAWTTGELDQSQLFPISRTAYYRALTADSATPVRIALPKPISGGCDMIKMLCRVPLNALENSSFIDYSLHYTYLDGLKNRVGGGIVSGNAYSSAIARYDSDSTIETVPSSVDRWYLNPPLDAEFIDITASRPVDISFFSRLEDPSRFEKVQGAAGSTTHIPDVRFQSSLLDNPDYYFRPVNADVLAREDRKIWINLPQNLLEATNSLFGSGQQLVAESCYPVSGSHPEWVFEPADDRETDGNCYIRFASGEPRTVRVNDTAAYARAGFQYRLQPVENPIITVMENDRVITRFRPVTFEGYFEISPLKIGNHVIRIVTPGCSDQIFMKRPANVSCDSGYYVARQTFRLAQGESLTMSIDKTSWQSTGLNILAYRDPDCSDPVVLTVANSMVDRPINHPISALTRSLIRFTGESQTQAAPVITGSGQRLTTPERFFYQIHDDQAPARYSVTIESQTESPVYLRFFILKPKTGQVS